jgi:hypothetical protein
MPAFPAYCPNCKSVFPFHGVAVGSDAQVRIGFESVRTNCPVCGYKSAQVSDAIYSANSSAFTVLSAPESSRAVIEAFKAIVEQAAHGRLSATEATQKAAQLSPKYASALEKFLILGAPGLMLLLQLIQIYLQYVGNKDSEKFLQAITEQTFVLKNNHYVGSVERHRSQPPHVKSNKKPSLKKHPSNRGAQVRKQRREMLRTRREAFGSARTH